jgi:serine/threonine protein phosphatase PrpC
MAFQTAWLSVGQSGRGDDRCDVLVHGDRIIITVVDGAGGSGRGAQAAETVLRIIRERSHDSAFDVVALLRDCDVAVAHEVPGGETTAVVAVVDETGIVGASVGDSGAWLIVPTSHIDLTQHQVRKPLIGTGHAIPTPFGCGPLTDTLLVATDGLLKYGNAARIYQIATTHDVDATPERFIESVKLRSGALQDDATVVICRRSLSSPNSISAGSPGSRRPFSIMKVR